MTFRAYWAARRLLYEEKWGVRIRQAETAEREEAERLSARYRKTVAALRGEEP